MTDLEITRWLADRIMGWWVQTTDEGRFLLMSPHAMCRSYCYPTIIPGYDLFDPLTDPRATAEVMEAMRRQGFEIEIDIEGDLSSAFIYKNPTAQSCRCIASEQGATTWMRAFCLAAVCATGGEP